MTHNRNSVLEKILLFFVVTACCFSLAGCNDRKKVEQYNKDFSAAIGQITSASAQMTDAVNKISAEFSEENRQAVLKAVEDMKAGYHALAALEAPRKYADVQAIFKESSDLFDQAAQIYTEEFTKVTLETFDEKFVERLKKGDEMFSKAYQRLSDGFVRGQEINEGKN